MLKSYTHTGGARIGWVNASWPFAKLSATQDQLRLKVTIAGEYIFHPSEVISMIRYTIIPILGWGIKITHNKPEYPDNIIFWTLGSPASVLTGIEESGFKPKPTSSGHEFRPRKGIVFRWQALVIVAAIWNILFLLDRRGQFFGYSPPGKFSLLALILLFFAALGTLRSSRFRNLMLKPGRDVGEVTPFLKLLLFVSGAMLFGFSLTVLLGHAR